MNVAESIAAISWKALEAVLAIIGGLAVAAGIWIGQFIAMTERHRTMCMASVFLAILFTLCILALYFSYFLLRGAH